jgi:hypothetical protein
MRQNLQRGDHLGRLVDISAIAALLLVSTGSRKLLPDVQVSRMIGRPRPLADADTASLVFFLRIHLKLFADFLELPLVDKACRHHSVAFVEKVAQKVGVIGTGRRVKRLVSPPPRASGRS